ncbi:MAG: PEP-CTERM sorting domain-containing protein [Candidatus Coatesbacteria bacterium]|nr:PEP-CTERM sorting domain-containing protein [Candidatus Coatesbacteria bacterium]
MPVPATWVGVVAVLAGGCFTGVRRRSCPHTP